MRRFRGVSPVVPRPLLEGEAPGPQSAQPPGMGWRCFKRPPRRGEERGVGHGALLCLHGCESPAWLLDHLRRRLGDVPERLERLRDWGLDKTSLSSHWQELQVYQRTAGLASQPECMRIWTT